jgi:uncharacterized membrane protein YkvA (DUF1232 family)
MTSTPNPQFELKKLPDFPRTLFEFEQYDGMKMLTVFLLLLSSVYLLTGFWGFLLDNNAWLHDWIYPPQPIPVQTQNPWWNPLGLFSQAKALGSAVMSYADMFFRLFIFICAFCLTWATFDPKNVEGYAMGLFNTFLGAAYVLAPIDLIPDSVPLMGSIDDTILGVGMVILGLSGWYRTSMRHEKTKMVLDLVDHGNTEKALQLLLEDKGITIKQLASQPSTDLM